MLLFPMGLVFFLVAHPTYAQSEKPLNQAQAVQIAEQFVLKTSYANETRSNSIMPRAIIALIKNTDSESFWSVQFLFRNQKPDRQYDFGREARVSLDGSRVRMGRKAIQIREARIMGDCLGEEKEKP